MSASALSATPRRGSTCGRKFDAWRRQYFHHRLIERAAELLASERDQPSMLYLRNETDIELLRMLAQWHRFDARLFRGFLVEESLWDSLKPEWFSPFPVCRVRDWQDRENTVVLTLSDSRPLRENGTDRGNDFLDCFIDESRLSVSDEVRQKLADRRVVLYVDYRKVQTLVALSEEIRKNSDFATVLLVNSAQGSCGAGVRRRDRAAFLLPLAARVSVAGAGSLPCERRMGHAGASLRSLPAAGCGDRLL